MGAVGDPTADALRGPRFEAKKKRFRQVGTYADHTRRAASEPYSTDLREFRRCILDGIPIPERMYRRGIDEDDDELLDLKGVKHIHLGGRNSNVLLYVIEFDDFVVALEINDHKHLDRKPVGKILAAHLMAPLKIAKAEDQDAKENAGTTATTEPAMLMRDRLLPKSKK